MEGWPEFSYLELIGVANVLSMHTMAPLAWQISEIAAMSTHRRYGFVGDSEKNSVTLWASREALSASRSFGLMTVTPMFILGRKFCMNCLRMDGVLTWLER